MKKKHIEKSASNGTLTARLKKADSDKWIDLWAIPIPNLQTNVGLAQKVLLMGDGTAAAFGYGAIGEGTAEPTVGDTALEDEVDRQAVNFSRITTSFANDTGQYVSTHTAPEGGWNITEHALVTLASGGVIYTRIVFAAISVAENDQLEMTYKLQEKRAA